MANINDLLKKLPKQNREGTPNELFTDENALGADTMSDAGNDFMQELERQELANMPDQQKVAINRDGLPDQPNPIQEAKIDNLNDKVKSPFQKNKDELSQDDAPAKTPLQQLLEKSNTLREKSGLDMEAARESDKKRAMIANLTKALGNLGAAKIQSDTGQKVGLEGFTPVKAEDSTSRIGKERDSLLNQLQGEYRLMQEAEPKDKSMNDYQKAQIQAAKDDRALRERLASLKATSDAAKKGKGLTKAQEEVDKKYAQEYNKFTESGMKNATNSIEKLEKLQKDVASDTGVGEAGGTRFPIPDMMRTRLSIERRDDARNFANKTLKELFGGQLSDAEREAAAREFWNDSLDNESNAKRLEGKIKELKDNLSMQTKKAKYYEKNKSLQDWAGVTDAEKEVQESAYPKQVRKDGKIATVSSAEEEKEAKSEGWQ